MKSEAEIRAELAEVELEAAKIRLEQTREANATYLADKGRRARENKQRQHQMKSDREDLARNIAECTHRQGGSPGRTNKGKGPSALRGIYFPQDERRLVMCSICSIRGGLRVWEPRKIDGVARTRKGESEAQMKARVAKFNEDLREFERLWEMAQDQLTPEAGQPMHCGRTFTFSDKEGNLAHVPHPCDGYAQGLDNRKALAA